MNSNTVIFLLQSKKLIVFHLIIYIIIELLDCTKEEKIIIIDMIQSLKDSLKEYRKEV